MNKYSEITIWQELLDAAIIIESWKKKQRQKYLCDLRKRERREGKTLYRNIFKLMLTSAKRRKYFIHYAKTQIKRKLCA